MDELPEHYLNSDKSWIISRLSEVPTAFQHETAHEYNRIYVTERRNSRKKANDYLAGVSLEYRCLEGTVLKCRGQDEHT